MMTAAWACGPGFASQLCQQSHGRSLLPATLRRSRGRNIDENPTSTLAIAGRARGHAVLMAVRLDCTTCARRDAPTSPRPN
jgi:hypothetical protein